jgi:hypothetical protein
MDAPMKIDRQCSGKLSDGEAGDNVRGVAGFAGLGDLPHRAIFRGGVVVCDEYGDAGHQQADDGRAVEIERRESQVTATHDVVNVRPVGNIAIVTG